MPTKNTTTQTSQFNPAGMTAYNTFMGGVTPYLQTALNNPMTLLNPLYGQVTQQAVKAAGQSGQTAMGNITGNMAAAGFGGQNLPAFLQSQINAQNRATSGNVANAFLGSQLQKLAAAQQLQSSAASTMAGFRPLQTGQTSTQTQSGLGTWLPMVAGAGLSALMPGGLLAGAFKGGAFPAASSMGQNMMGNFVSPGNSLLPTNPGSYGLPTGFGSLPPSNVGQ